MTAKINQPVCGRARGAATLGVAVALFLGALGFQWLGGAYQSEFGSHPDEAAHYVTGLVVRDYLAAGFPAQPLTYAQDYYRHYPKVALGHWPPFFYVLQSAWTLVFSPGRVPVLMLMALLTALAAFTVFCILRAELNAEMALAGAGLFLALPLIQQSSSAVMTEIPITLLVLLATLCFGRYLERERTADALAFGLLASLAILTKFSGFVLAFVPPLALLLTRKFHLLQRPAFWCPLALVVGLCGPWTALTLKLASEGLSGERWGWAFTHQAVPYYLGKFYAALGAGVFLLAALGVFARLRPQGPEHRPAGLWSAAGALLAGVLLLHMLVPCGFEARHLAPALPVAVLFALAGAAWLAGWLARRGVAPGMALLLTLGAAALAFTGQTFRITQKGYCGFGPVAESLLRDPGATGAVFLVSSDARGEGMFIAEVAMREKRPGHQVRRGSKELASSSWSGRGYQSKFSDEESLRAFLRSSAVGYLVLDTSLQVGGRKEDHDLLLRAVESAPESFTLESCFPIQRAGRWRTNALRLYRCAGPEP